MRNNKMSSVFIVAVLALAGIGISYAGWTDLITVSGTVSNGDVDINVRGYSATWVYKDVDEHDVIYHHGLNIAPYDQDDNPPANPEDFLVAWAYSEPAEDDNGIVIDDAVHIVFENLFPCQDFIADFIIHYEGSIPGRVYGSQEVVTDNVIDGPYYEPQYLVGTDANWMEDLWACAHGLGEDGFGIWLEHYELINVQTDADGMVISYELGDMIDNGHQMHDCEYVIIFVYIHIPQNNAYQLCSGDFYINYGAIQYDEYTDDLPDTIIPTP